MIRTALFAALAALTVTAPAQPCSTLLPRPRRPWMVGGRRPRPCMAMAGIGRSRSSTDRSAGARCTATSGATATSSHAAGDARTAPARRSSA